MIKIIFCLMLIYNPSIPIYYKTIDQIPFILPVKSVAFHGPDALWLVTEKGNLLCTRNGGTAWSKIDGNAVNGFEQISFIGAQLGWAINDKAQVWRTIDGGKTWHAISKINSSSAGAISQINFIDKLHGWVVEPFSIWRTEDGGVSWQQYIPSSGSNGINEILDRSFFIDAKIGWLYGVNGAIYRTKDGGQTWQGLRLTSRGTDIHGVSFINNYNGWICTRPKGYTYYTDDGGESWRLQQIQDKDVGIYAIQFVSKTEGWAIGNEKIKQKDKKDIFQSVILYTKDAGNSWQSAQTIEGGVPNHIFFGDKQHGWVVAGNLVYRSGDGGKTWSIALRVQDTEK